MSQPPAAKRKAEVNKLLNAKRKPEDRHPRFSWTIEVGIDEGDRLNSIRERIQAAKETLGISRKSSATQNADLLENLLDIFESSRKTPDTGANDGNASEPCRKQIVTPAIKDDELFVCSKGSLDNLLQYFVKSSRCEFCGNSFVLCKTEFERQGHVCKIVVLCVKQHRVTWLSSSFFGQPAKYLVNLR